MIKYTSYESDSSRQHTANMPHKKFCKEEDTEEVASFLLSLKHRSVTPEPTSDDSASLQPSNDSPCSQVYGYPTKRPYVDKTPAVLGEQQSPADTPVEALLGDSKLVLAKDRDLVPDALFVAMAQMTPCKLSQADRVGCYKTREIGFVGMCCMHCGGQPGFGRYYPNSVRSLAQTTTSQTILKHVGSKCRFCPAHIRDAVNELQRQQAVREGMSSGRPRYGSRKIFFQRVWARLHGGPLAEEFDGSKAVADAVADDSSNQTPSDLESESRRSSPATSDDEGNSEPPSLKRGFGFLPTQKNLKRSMAAAADPPAAKRSRHVLSISI
jgi:hypothetical protein